MKTLADQKEHILLLMDYAVNPEDLDEARGLLDRYQDDQIALHLFREFYSYLPDAANDAIKLIRNLDRKEGTFLLQVTTVNDSYLYIANKEGAEFLGRHEEGIWDQEVLEFLGITQAESVNRYKKLEAFPVYVPAHLDPKLCPVCLAADGEFHRSGCPVEICPWCGGQLVHCNCRFEQTGKKTLTTEAQLAGFEALLEQRGRVPFNAREQRLSFAKGGE